MACGDRTPLVKKLGVKEGHTLGLIGIAADFEATLAPLPDGVAVRHQARGRFDVIVYFPAHQGELRRRFAQLARHMVANGGLWIGWPKKASKVPTDLSFDVVQTIGLEEGLVDNKICAIDETYSGLRFVVRVENRAGWPPD